MGKNKFALGAMIGAIAGAIAGLLAAPKSGKETRADIKAKADGVKTEAGAKYNNAKGDAKLKVQEVTQTANNKVDEVKDKAYELKARGENAVDAAKKGFNKKV